MNLHSKGEVFNDLIMLTSRYMSLPIDAVRKDYFITLILENLSESEFVDSVVFKGGTSLSKCYPGTIERFSEDIDLTFIPEEGLTDKQINRRLKSIERVLIGGAKSEIIREERNNRNKSSYVWFTDEDKDAELVKLEIGSSVRPHPYSKKVLRSYIQDYLLSINEGEAIVDFQLDDVEVNVLDIERTFIDKIMSVKRHSICGTLNDKVRHIYDIVKLFQLVEIQEFLQDESLLKDIVKLTKDTDSVYLEKRNIPKEYNPKGAYGFELWRDKFNIEIRGIYESLHKSLLYTDVKQDFNEAIDVFRLIDRILQGIDE